MRGLVPGDWSDESGLARKLRKLLTVLGAPSFGVQPPNCIDAVCKADSQSPSVLPARIVKVSNVVPREGFRFGSKQR
jgi:hypothetical protein